MALFLSQCQGRAGDYSHSFTRALCTWISNATSSQHWVRTHQLVSQFVVISAATEKHITFPTALPMQTHVSGHTLPPSARAAAVTDALHSSSFAHGVPQHQQCWDPAPPSVHHLLVCVWCAEWGPGLTASSCHFFAYFTSQYSLGSMWLKFLPFLP